MTAAKRIAEARDKNLTTLNLSGTKVSDAGPLAGLHNLTTLHLGDTGISDAGPLAGLHNLTTLDLWGTKVSAPDIAALRKALPRATIYARKDKI